MTEADGEFVAMSMAAPLLLADDAVTVWSPDGAPTKFATPPPTSCCVPVPPERRSITTLAVPEPRLVMFSPS